MSKQTEDTMYEIHQEVENKKDFVKNLINNLKKCKSKDKHNNKTVCERWEYALRRIKE